MLVNCNMYDSGEVCNFYVSKVITIRCLGLNVKFNSSSYILNCFDVFSIGILLQDFMIFSIQTGRNVQLIFLTD